MPSSPIPILPDLGSAQITIGKTEAVCLLKRAIVQAPWITKDMPPEQFREVRNLIEEKVKGLLTTL
jgi:hypothetical protein